MYMSLSKLREIVKDRDPWHVAVHVVSAVRHDLTTEQQHKSKERSADVRLKTQFPKQAISAKCH